MGVALTLLTYVVWFMATFMVVFFLLLLLSGANRLWERKPLPKGWKPKVSVIVPAFNEEGKIAKTIASLKKLRYTNFEVIVVNDGSRDGTSKEVKAAIAGDRRFRFLDRKENRGKAASMNQAIAHAKGEFIATMDADSMVEPGVFTKVLGFFCDETVGAVTISVAVHKPKSFIHRIIELEYIIGLSLFLKVFSVINCVFVTPGPFSVYRKKVLQEVGGFDEENITEDLEIAYKIHKAGYRIETARDAFVHTIVPPSFKEIYYQRRRWYSGAVQTLAQHRSMLFKPKYGSFGLFMPFQFALVTLGLVVFLLAFYVGVEHFIEFFNGIRYTGFETFRRMLQEGFHVDFMKLKSITVLGWLAFSAGMALLFIGLKASREKIKDKLVGIVGYPLLFIMYQIFWIGAFIAVIRRKKISWR